jgi:hypothetical protein
MPENPSWVFEYTSEDSEICSIVLNNGTETRILSLKEFPNVVETGETPIGLFMGEAMVRI